MIIIKIGGGKDINIEGITGDIAGLNEPCLIVHGANALRDEIAERLGTPKKVLTSLSGYSSVYSDEAAINTIMMTYAGLRNKRIVESCQKSGINAVGLTGLDGRLVKGKRNQGIRIQEGVKRKIVRDFSGKPRSVNTELLNFLIGGGYTPVLTIPIIDENNTAINSENDDIVNVLQDAVHAGTIIQLIEAPGFLDDRDNPDSLIKCLSQEELKKREEQVEGRMKRKILALTRLFENGAGTVIISDGRTEHPVVDALNGKGTKIT